MHVLFPLGLYLLNFYDLFDQMQQALYILSGFSWYLSHILHIKLWSQQTI